MAGGDLLYIVAFIILPTAVLVSCVWALVLLRKGALLPARPVARHDISQKALASADGAEGADGSIDQVEETGEHMVIPPAAETAVPVTSAAAVAGPSPARAPEERPVAPPMPQPLPADDGPPRVDRTEELSVVQVAAEQSPERANGVSDDDIAIAPAKRDVVSEAAGVVPVLDVAVTDSEASDVLIVPLDEPATVSEGGVSSIAAPAEAADAGHDHEAAHQEALNAPGPRRTPRRVAQPRPVDDSAPRTRLRAGQRRSPRRPDGEG